MSAQSSQTRQVLLHRLADADIAFEHALTTGTQIGRFDVHKGTHSEITVIPVDDVSSSLAFDVTPAGSRLKSTEHTAVWSTPYGTKVSTVVGRTDGTITQNKDIRANLYKVARRLGILYPCAFIVNGPSTMKESEVEALVMPRMANGDISSFLLAAISNRVAIPEKIKLKWSIQIGHQVAILHAHASASPVSRLRMGTVYLDGDLNAVVSAVRSSNYMGDSIAYVSSGDVESSEYDEIAPEHFRILDTGVPTEVYAYGMLLWKIWSGKKVYNDVKYAVSGGLQRMQLIRADVIAGVRPDASDISIRVVQSMITRAWDPIVANRPSVADMVTEFEYITKSHYGYAPVVSSNSADQSDAENIRNEAKLASHAHTHASFVYRAAKDAVDKATAEVDAANKALRVAQLALPGAKSAYDATLSNASILSILVDNIQRKLGIE
jgi:hypothetical protein